MSYTDNDITALGSFYRKQLLGDTVPFWFPRSFDRDYGGYLLMRDHDGTLIDDDKAVWIQGRATWLLATLYNTVEKRPEWLEGAKLGYAFLIRHCFDSDGQMFFHVTRDGRPIRKRRYIFKSGDPDKIAASVKHSAETSKRRKSSPYRSAMSILTFYGNRAGKNLSADEKDTLEKAKNRLRELFGGEDKNDK